MLASFALRGRHRGFTLTEMTVVLAIIMVLFSLLLPAVQRARDAARRVQCQSQLMQIGLALQNYRMAHDVLPPGCVNLTRPISSIESQDQYHMSWIVQILPFLEEKNAFNRVDFSSSVYATENSEVRQHAVHILVCPADSTIITKNFGRTSYFGVHNDFETPIDVDQNGVLFLNSSIRRKQIADGDSQTIFVMEGKQDSGGIGLGVLGWMSGTKASLRNGVQWINRDAAGADATPEYVNHVSPPHGNEVIVKEQQDLKNGVEYVGGPSSYHIGGYHVAMGDGSVRFVSTSIESAMLRRLTHRADGELVEDF